MGGIECNSNRAGSFEVYHRFRPDSHRAVVTPFVAARPDKPAVAHDTLNSPFTWILILVRFFSLSFNAGKSAFHHLSHESLFGFLF